MLQKYYKNKSFLHLILSIRDHFNEKIPNKANLEMTQMFVTKVLTGDYNRKDLVSWEKQSQFKANQSQFAPVQPVVSKHSASNGTKKFGAVAF